jgi:hypothetical protein
MLGLLAMDANILNNFMFNGAHRIPEGLEEVKRVMLVNSRGWRVKARKDEVKRVVRSIQECGIRAGGFQVIERESTLIFMGFSFQKILELLITF